MNYRKPVWIDTDISIDYKHSSKAFKEVDDTLALISLINSKTIEIKGISSTFANTDSTHSYLAAKKIVKKFSSSKIKVYKGANRPIKKNKLQESDASKALAKSLKKGSLRILSLGSATNIATVILKYPHLVEQIEEIIAMSGSRRTPNDHFIVGPKQKLPFDAINFESDVQAWKIILNSNIPITFIPFETSHKVWIDKQDIDQIANGGESGEYLEPHMIKCTNQWKKEYGTTGFNPFDTLAAGYLLAPHMFSVETLPAGIKKFPSDTIQAKDGKPPKKKPYLFISKMFNKNRRVHYCYDVSDEFKQYLIDSLKGSFQMSLDVIAQSHINVVVDDIEKATEFYSRTLGFKIACNEEGPIDFKNYQSPTFARDAGFLDGKVRVDVRFLKHPQAGIYLELMRYYYPCGKKNVTYKNTNDMGGVGHIALEVTDVKRVFNYLKKQPDVKMINSSKKYGPPKKLDNFDILFFYWLDPYGVQWEMEQGRPVNYGIITG